MHGLGSFGIGREPLGDHERDDPSSKIWWFAASFADAGNSGHPAWTSRRETSAADGIGMGQSSACLVMRLANSRPRSLRSAMRFHSDHGAVAPYQIASSGRTLECVLENVVLAPRHPVSHIGRR
jgi:hypothetical protein